MCRDAELPARTYTDLVASALGTLHDPATEQTLFRQAATAARDYADPSWRGQGLDRLADAADRCLRAAEPGSDAQLGYVEGLAAVASSNAHLTRLAAILDGSDVPAGLVVGPDLRWTLLHRLVGRGMADEVDIAALLERDGTLAGGRRAAACRAAIPDPAAKRAAWRRLTEPGLRPAEFRATVAGFADPDQGDLLAPYAAAYFAAVAGIWRDRPTPIAKRFALGGYPFTQIDERTLRMTDACLSSPGTPAALARLLTECRADLARALKARARDLSGP
jgi:aminopeptidase N